MSLLNVAFAPAKTGRSKCKNTKCKGVIEAKTVRLAKITKNPFADEGEMPNWSVILVAPAKRLLKLF
jgi:hypothetical protein